MILKRPQKIETIKHVITDEIEMYKKVASRAETFVLLRQKLHLNQTF